MYILKMALLNIRRNRMRTALAALCVFAAVFANMVMGGLMRGMMSSIVKNYTKNQTGHVRISSPGFSKNDAMLPVDELIPDGPAVMDAIRADPYLASRLDSVNERLSFTVLLSNADSVRPALTMAGDLEGEKKLLMLQKSVLKPGAYPSAPGQALMGERLASALGLGLGSTVKVVTEKSDSGLRMKKFTISGLISTGVGSMDSSLLFISLSDAKALLKTGEASQQILVQLKDYRDSDKAAAGIGRALAGKGLSEGVAVQSWTGIGEYPSLVAMMGKIYLFLYFGMSFLGAFIITNVLMMIVLERKKEIGVLKSMGMRPREILMLFCAEGAAMGAIGSLAGSLAGWGFNALVTALRGYNFSSVTKNLAFPMDSSILPSTDLGMVLTVFCVGVIVSALVSIGPSRMASGMNPIDAIKSV
jgi:putative ABC transport system permease protein